MLDGNQLALHKQTQESSHLSSNREESYSCIKVKLFTKVVNSACLTIILFILISEGV